MKLAAGDLLTVRAALKLLPVGRSTLYKLIDEGAIPAIRVGAAGGGRGRLLIHRDDLAAYVAGARQGAARAATRVDVDDLLAQLRKGQK